MENKIYKISKEELNSLLLFYWSILNGLDNTKGLAYLKFFELKKKILSFKTSSKNISDYIIVEENNNVD